MKHWLTVVSLLVLCSSVALAQEGATLTGKVNFEGDAPKRKKLDMSAEPTCEAKHGEAGTLDEKVVVNENKTLQYAMVFVTKGLEGKKFEAPKDPVLVSQHGCIYTPHVIGLMLGQKIVFKNGDAVTHNVHGTPKMNNEFNFGQNQQGQENPVDLTTAEAGIRVKCDVHSWMNCFVHVLEHPFFAVTGADGTYTIKGLPAGDYELKLWHEKSKTGWTQSVKVGDKESKTVDWTVKAEELK